MHDFADICGIWPCERRCRITRACTSTAICCTWHEWSGSVTAFCRETPRTSMSVRAATSQSNSFRISVDSSNTDSGSVEAGEKTCEGNVVKERRHRRWETLRNHIDSPIEGPMCVFFAWSTVLLNALHPKIHGDEEDKELARTSWH